MKKTPGKIRDFINPAARLPLPPDFPDAVSPHPNFWPSLLTKLEEQLARRGAALADVKQITLAYPHRDPRKSTGRNDVTEELVHDLRDTLAKARPGISWVVAEGICETIYLNRSDRQSSVDTLTRKQKYSYVPELQNEPLAFTDPDLKDQKHFFVIVDDRMDQGTTAINLWNWITANGGDVLAVAAHSSGSHQNTAVAQKKEMAKVASLTGDFADASRNTARLEQLAQAFHDSLNEEKPLVAKNFPPQECMESFADALLPFGITPDSLTDGECRKLLRSLEGLEGKPVTFMSLIAELRNAAPKP